MAREVPCAIFWLMASKITSAGTITVPPPYAHHAAEHPGCQPMASKANIVVVTFMFILQKDGWKKYCSKIQRK